MDMQTALGIIATSLVVPYVVALISRPDLTPDRKRAIALAASVLLGLLAAILTGGVPLPAQAVDWIGRAVVVVATVTGLAQGFYRAIPGIGALEASTTPGYTPERIAPEDAS